MLVTTEAIVLSKINYSETSLIVRCYTLSDGLKSYIVKGSKQGRNGKKNTALFQPLNQLEITSQHKAKSSLSIPKSTKIWSTCIGEYGCIQVFKNIQALFLIIALVGVADLGCARHHHNLLWRQPVKDF